MYDELIKKLRYLAKVYSVCNNENTQEYRLAVQAADAIEELQVRLMYFNDAGLPKSVEKDGEELPKSAE